MEAALKDSLASYYVQLSKTYEKWKEFLKKVERPLEALKNKSEHYRHVVSNDVDNAEIFQLDNLRDKIIFKIIIAIEDEISLVLNELRRAKNFVEDLKIKLQRLENVRSDAILSKENFKELVEGTPLIPRLDLLLEWAIESFEYYRTIVDKIFQSFTELDYTKADSVEKFIKSFDCPSRRDKAAIERILAFTQFLVNGVTK